MYKFQLCGIKRAEDIVFRRMRPGDLHCFLRRIKFLLCTNKTKTSATCVIFCKFVLGNYVSWNTQKWKKIFLLSIVTIYESWLKKLVKDLLNEWIAFAPV